MFDFIKSKRRRITKHVSNLIASILEALPDDYAELKSYENNRILDYADYVPNPGGGTTIYLMAYLKPGINKSESIERGNSFELSGITIKHKKTGIPLEVILPIWQCSISNICFRPENLDILQYDVYSVSIENLSSKKLIYVNPDIDKLKKLLKGIADSDMDKLEIEDTFEIETELNKYYTIFDMEDGNYIAIDRKKKVYRLKHDDVEPEKVISQNIMTFMNDYSGNKQDLQKYFN